MNANIEDFAIVKLLPALLLLATAIYQGIEQKKLALILKCDESEPIYNYFHERTREWQVILITQRHSPAFWQQIAQNSDFKWHHSSQFMKFEQQSSVCTNHLPNNYLLTNWRVRTKAQQKQQQRLNETNILESFIIDLAQSDLSEDEYNFLEYYDQQDQLEDDTDLSIFSEQNQKSILNYAWMYQFCSEKYCDQGEYYGLYAHRLKMVREVRKLKQDDELRQSLGIDDKSNQKKNLVLTRLLRFPFLIDEKKIHFSCFLLLTNSQLTLKGKKKPYLQENTLQAFFHSGYARKSGSIYKLLTISDDKFLRQNYRDQLEVQLLITEQKKQKVDIITFYNDRQTLLTPLQVFKTTEGIANYEKLYQSYIQMKQVVEDFYFDVKDQIIAPSAPFYDILEFEFALESSTFTPKLFQVHENVRISEQKNPEIKDFSQQLTKQMLNIVLGHARPGREFVTQNQFTFDKFVKID